MKNNYDPNFMKKAVELSEIAYIENKGLPIGCVIVKDNEIVGQGHNEIFLRNNPTAHAEMVAIEDACKKTKALTLEGCDLYTMLEPCPMCLGAIYWAGLQTVYFANTSENASAVGFNDLFIFDELCKSHEERKIKTIHIADGDALKVLKNWKATHTDAHQPWSER